MKATIKYRKTGHVQTVEISKLEYIQRIIILDLIDGGFYSFTEEDNVEIVVE